MPVELVQGALNDEAFLDQAMDGIEVVYHLAKADGSKWEDYYTQDVQVTKKIAERAIANNVKRFIYTGTIDSYYSADKNEVITADTPLDPSIEKRNLYARSKATCEALLKNLHVNQNLPLVIMRPGVVIGHGCPPAHWGVGMFQTETRVRYWGDGKNKIPLVLVDDVASALLAAMNTPDIEGQTFLLTDEPLMTARDYVDAVSKEAGTRIQAAPSWIWRLYLEDAFKETIKHLIRHPNRRYPSYRDWDSRSHRARYDNSKTKDILGWKPHGTKQSLIEQGIAPAVREFLD
jgi:nucleoside-diphosphate-sugar epimerase